MLIDSEALKKRLDALFDIFYQMAQDCADENKMGWANYYLGQATGVYKASVEVQNSEILEE